MDGHDMGVGSLLPFLGKDDNERRVMINSVAPHWDGNQVWLITGGGAMFAAWPMMYATAFSGFYWAIKNKDLSDWQPLRSLFLWYAES